MYITVKFPVLLVQHSSPPSCSLDFYENKGECFCFVSDANFRLG